MKKVKKHPRSPKEAQITRLSIVPGITVIAVVMVLVFALLFLVLWRSDNMILYFGGFFSFSDRSSGDGENAAGEIRVPPETDVSLSGDRFFTPDFEEASKSAGGIADLLETMRRCDRYRQTFLISCRSGNPEVVSVMRDGERYRIESSEFLVVCDGHTVYMRRNVDGEISFTNRWNVSEGVFSLENEVGIPSLDSLIAVIKRAESLPVMTFDEKKKTITLEEITDNDIIRSVTVTYETGMILYASSETAEGELLTECESMFSGIDPEFSEELFLVPMT